MDATRFDRLTRAAASRRGLFGSVGTTLAGLLGALALGDVQTGASQAEGEVQSPWSALLP